MTTATVSQTKTRATVRTGPRLVYMDAFRVGLTALVVLHHVAMSYGAAGLGFYFVDLPPEFISRNLLVFVLANQAWFMGAFFLVAGYFTPTSFDRKGPDRFVRSRIMRLGLPALFYVFVLNPLATGGWFFVPDALGPLTWDTFDYWDYVRMGPTWFLVLLLLFSLGYVGWRVLMGDRSGDTQAGGTHSADIGARSTPGLAAIGVFVLALTATSFLVRMGLEVGEELWGFPSLAYLPQYLSFFVIGVVGARLGWLKTLPTRTGIAGLAAAGAGTLLLFPLAFSGKMFSLELTESLNLAMGDGTWRSAVYALWDSTQAVGLTLGLLVVLRAFVTERGALLEWLARGSYAVYLIHIPVVVYVAVALRDVDLSRPGKITAAATIALALSYLLASVIRRIPGVPKVV